MDVRPPDRSDIAQIDAARIDEVASFGLTDRQARFLVTVMLHSGVFVGRQYCAFAGITHGQKVHDFVEKLLARRLATATTIGAQQRARVFHVHHKPLYAAIGERDNRHRKPVPIARAIERLMILDGVLDVAQLLRTTNRAIYAMIERRQLPGIVRIGRRVLFRTADLLDWLNQKSAPSQRSEQR